MGIDDHKSLEQRFRAVYGSLVPGRITPAALARKLEEMFSLDGPSLERELRKLVSQGRPRPRLTWYIGWALQDYYCWLNGPVLLWYAGHLGPLARLHIGFARVGATIDIGRKKTRAITERGKPEFPDRASRALFLGQEHLLETHDALFAEQSDQDAVREEGIAPTFDGALLINWERVWEAWVAKPAVSLAEDLDLRVALEFASLTSSLTFAERESEISVRLNNALSRRLSGLASAPWEWRAKSFWDARDWPVAVGGQNGDR